LTKASTANSFQPSVPSPQPTMPSLVTTLTIRKFRQPASTTKVSTRATVRPAAAPIGMPAPAFAWLVTSPPRQSSFRRRQVAPDILAVLRELARGCRQVAGAHIGKELFVAADKVVVVAAVLPAGDGDEFADGAFEERPHRDEDRVARVGVEDAMEAHVEP